ncbi:MAG: hypothetical protein AVDCRST_MAG09-1045 [uncultured Sphingomonas sp.]|uniref:Uncharacterized protein n=1 Tax=uncultured Sphingomonas sp. TaxID=158754 RepID=A0A6J4SUQ2_9SPHN|nr:hypothetical protein [uncultured Sphingomonas sp.]CAA9505678.1 MAG: hypothetical protein AVDCRST_MAG09-1045 [uncultured Sphingomonas sp.]
MKAAYSTRVFALVAFTIAATAFGIGQLQPGAGVLFVIAASTGWVVWNSNRRVTRG